jgi:hypothetical protein
MKLELQGKLWAAKAGQPGHRVSRGTSDRQSKDLMQRIK